MQKKNVTYIKCDIYKGKACFQNILFFMAFLTYKLAMPTAAPVSPGPPLPIPRIDFTTPPN